MEIPSHLPTLRILSLVGWMFVLLVPSARGQTNLKYQQPPKAIVDLVDARPTPTVRLSPAKAQMRWMLIEQLSGLPSIADLAQPELRLAGLRFNPRTNGPSRGRYFTSLRIQALPKGKEIAISGLPANPKIISVEWSPDARRISFVNVGDSKDDAGLSLWIVDVATTQARRLPGIALNGIFGEPCEWRGDSQSLVCRTIPADRGPAPSRSEIPMGPVIQENLGRVTPGATYEDLLKNPEDELIFDYYASSQLRLISLDGASKPIGKPGVVVDASFSPDGNYVLVSERHHPYSYLLPFEHFPERVSVLDLKNNASAKQLVDKPLQDNIPRLHDAVPAGPREYMWRSDAPATVFWVEAGDGGDPRKEVAIRDTLFLLDAPFDAAPRKLLDLPVRYRSVEWANDRLALVEERRWKDRKRIILAVAPSAPGSSVKLFEGSFEDRYHDPGRPIEVRNAAGKPVLQTTPDGYGIYFQSQGASPEGDKPFLSVTNATNGETKRLWQSAAPFYEIPWAVLDPGTQTILIRRESQEKSPNFYIAKSRKPVSGPDHILPKSLWRRRAPQEAGAALQAFGWRRSERRSLPAAWLQTSGRPAPHAHGSLSDRVQDESGGGTNHRLALRVHLSVLGFARALCHSRLRRARKSQHSDRGRRERRTQRHLCRSACRERKSRHRRRGAARGRGPQPRRRHGAFLRRLHDRQSAGSQRPVQGGHRAQRSLQPDSHSVRLPE